jgi:hypothetical protein
MLWVVMDRDGIKPLLEQAATLPEAEQYEFLASLNETETMYSGVYQLSEDERAAVRRGLAEVRAGQLASEEEVAALFNRFR